MPALVITHGQCAELDFVGDMLFGLAGLKNVRTDWQMMQHVAREIAAQGVIVFMIGMPDDDGADDSKQQRRRLVGPRPLHGFQGA